MLAAVHPTIRLALRLAAGFVLSVMTTFAASSIYDIPVNDIDGHATTLAAYKGKVMLIVNVASLCGNTPQYKDLEALFAAHEQDGLVVLGFPCNQFGQQEPGTNAEIKQFCSSTYHVSFPLFDKIDVNGEHRHPLYVFLAGADSPFPGDIGWNFAKFLVGRDGHILHRFDPREKVTSPAAAAAIAAAIAASK